MKTVFSNRQCAHVWAQQSQDSGHSDSMSFRGPKAYSYAALVAHIVAAPNGQRVALLSSHTYSVTTTRHVSYYRNAVGGIRAFTVPAMLGDDRADIANPQSLAHRTNVHYLTAEYEKERDGMMRAPSVSWRIQDNRPHEELGELSREVQLYQECFRLPVTDLPWSADADAVVARRERLLNSPEAIARRAESTRRMLESRRQDLLRDAEQLAAWRAGALLPTFDYTLEDDSACFRIKGDNVETSRGATVPVADVRRVMRVYQLAVKANALPWERGDYARQDEETRLGHFRLDHIDASGNVRAGCHYFNAAEAAHLATLLGV